jgi:hypothetical protein
LLSLGRSHLAYDVVERLLSDGTIERLARHLPGVQVHAGQLGVIIQHLLEVGCNTQYVFCTHCAVGAGQLIPSLWLATEVGSEGLSG